MTDLNLDQFYDRESYFGEQLDAVNKNFLTNGKKLRAYFLNSIGLSLDINEDSTYVMARCTEMIHNATLCHDDVIDNATMRRETPSINQQIDNKKSVLVGDFLLARAIQELCALKSLELQKPLSYSLKASSFKMITAKTPTLGVTKNLLKLPYIRQALFSPGLSKLHTYSLTQTSPL